MTLATARLAVCLAALMATPAAADVAIAFVGALSGPVASAGRDQRDAFALALTQRNGRLGGVPVKLLEMDDAGDAHRARAIAERLAANRVPIVTGLTTTASALALHERLRGQDVVMLSSGAGPLALAAEKCSSMFFSTAAPDDVVHENAGAIASNRRYADIVVLGASEEQRAFVQGGFQRSYAREVAWRTLRSGEDPADAIRAIRAAPPAALYLALEPPAALRFLKAYADVGLFHRIPVIAAGVEPRLLEDLGPAFSGLMVSVRWAAGLERPVSTRFAEAFRERYGRTPSSYAMQSFDAALLLDQALRAAKSTSAPAVATALAATGIEGVGQPLAFADNGFVATDWHAWEVFNESSGAPYLATREPTLWKHAGAHASRCRRPGRS